jgi:hypothetical protein
MGMYDTFILKIPIQCTNCYTGAFSEFQTKQFECCLDEYVQGKPAVAYYLRDETPDEYEEKIKHYREFEPEWLDNPKLRPWVDFIGCMHRTDKAIPGSQIPDGKYKVYEYCPNCNRLFYVKVVIKNGIFVGVEESGA